MTSNTKTAKPKPVRVQLRQPGGTVERHLIPALEGRWLDLPEQLSLWDLNVVGHMVDGYALGKKRLGREAFELADELRQTRRRTRKWDGNAIELLVTFFAVVRGWRGLYEDPVDGDENHREAQALYEAIRRRLREHPNEVRLIAAKPESPLGGSP